MKIGKKDLFLAMLVVALFIETSYFVFSFLNDCREEEIEWIGF